ncbi:uncharacterized protein [Oryza sativa Japonica Group]|uniref:Os02g0827400 protein n=2 Tax=Oryza sativa subsp. japonica TaxID=39947 RepID=A3ACX5_ORYSJ|nr:uncharacterized protein LOC4331223 isoform X1 [Oryza sativa Japonica Group]EAZ25164.1 hypothetical protein OsJ_08965 [Oryza sativa Japonica Group]KAF2947768.1 hypothetical protein DAI22_02g392900 [Oryza sativa Japonica Group]BAD23056.1 hypothetical protein [Oryza sativa Japonica Group]BAF10507.1 Os02g0827400 [Oryza sativa Japonica Group]|eukprot:NP_001048593.1 Os02g0827400 [Oryza sativa Japonica Group]
MEKKKSNTDNNLEVFLQAATPCLRWRSASMECFQDPSKVWQLDKKKDEVDYFALEDLWEHYAESSAYGLAVPVRLESGNTITQHFVPYLSAIQIYTSTKSLLAFSRGSAGSESDSWSDDSTGDKLSRSWDAAMSDDDDSSHDSSESVSAKQGAGCLNFQYNEWSSPYERVPLADKVAELAQHYPCLTSLSSAQLSPSSWMSVAWYPIYHIPARGNLKGLSTCFLTYHSLSSVFQDNVEEGRSVVGVSPFGLATYRAEGKLWTSSRSSDLFWAASSWLKQLRAYHPDFIFFTSHCRQSAF